MKKHIPNIITCCNLVCGCIAVGAGFHGNYGTAFLFILLGAVFDFFDGLVARALGVSGPIGKELDSLADVVTFGLAPSAIMFTLFSHVYYPMFMYSSFWFKLMPFTAFIMTAFSAMRLAKFNCDERQHMGFIGMPTPANAIFWGALISSSQSFLCGPRFSVVFLFLFMIMFSWLLVCEIPMFALKFKNMSWGANKMKYIFLMLCIAVLVLTGIIGASDGHVWQTLSQGIAGCIGLYIFMSILALYLQDTE